MNIGRGILFSPRVGVSMTYNPVTKIYLTGRSVRVMPSRGNRTVGSSNHEKSEFLTTLRYILLCGRLLSNAGTLELPLCLAHQAGSPTIPSKGQNQREIMR